MVFHLLEVTEFCRGLGSSTLTTLKNIQDTNIAVVAALVDVHGRAIKHATDKIEFAIGSTRGEAVFSQMPDSSTSIQITTRFGHTGAAAAVAILLFPIGVLFAAIWYFAVNVNAAHERLVTAIRNQLGGNAAVLSGTTAAMPKENVSLRSQSRIFCVQCGKALPTERRFCTFCGAAVPAH
jgi:hypothetical protein